MNQTSTSLNVLKIFLAALLCLSSVLSVPHAWSVTSGLQGYDPHCLNKDHHSSNPPSQAAHPFKDHKGVIGHDNHLTDIVCCGHTGDGSQSLANNTSCCDGVGPDHNNCDQSQCHTASAVAVLLTGSGTSVSALPPGGLASVYQASDSSFIPSSLFRPPIS